MATEVKPKPKTRRGRNAAVRRYRFTADQALKMVEAGIIPESEHIELWDGVFYRMTKRETHNLIVGLLGDLIRPMLPPGFHLREEKSSRKDEWSIPEPDLAVCKGNRGDYWPD